ncbi:hypothetical protein BJV78DRAFT_1354311 [Lactifluus subvellereus]|nr:hypothetical protein BJV78DRAFT_1354311 [Lactifluus subvellereus]
MTTGRIISAVTHLICSDDFTQIAPTPSVSLHTFTMAQTAKVSGKLREARRHWAHVQGPPEKTVAAARAFGRDCITNTGQGIPKKSVQTLGELRTRTCVFFAQLPLTLENDASPYFVPESGGVWPVTPKEIPKKIYRSWQDVGRQSNRRYVEHLDPGILEGLDKGTYQQRDLAADGTPASRRALVSMISKHVKANPPGILVDHGS